MYEKTEDKGRKGNKSHKICYNYPVGRKGET
jgi:hypothetical protein